MNNVNMFMNRLIFSVVIKITYFRISLSIHRDSNLDLGRESNNICIHLSD